MKKPGVLVATTSYFIKPSPTIAISLHNKRSNIFLNLLKKIIFFCVLFFKILENIFF